MTLPWIRGPREMIQDSMTYKLCDNAANNPRDNCLQWCLYSSNIRTYMKSVLIKDLLRALTCDD